jgi:DNA repair protein RadC
MKLKELCADERPREKMLDKGSASLSNAELLAIMLRTGTEKLNALEIAQSMLKATEGRLEDLAGMSVENLCAFDGVGPSKAVTIAAAFELGRRHATEKASDNRLRLSSPKTVFRLMYPLLKDIGHEECWAIYTNKTNLLLGKDRLSSGGEDSTVIDNRMIIRRAIERKASGVILVHNHPSGHSFPSTEDINQTRTLQSALKTCGLALIDHVIIGNGNYYSFTDETLTEC